MLNQKILFWVRPDFYTFPGGDTGQAEDTARALLELGCEVDISSDSDLEIGKYDIIHLWHLERCHDNWLFFQKAKKNQKRIFLSPIYWPSDHLPLIGFWKKQYRSAKENMKYIIRIRLTDNKKQKQFILAALKKGWLHCREQLLNDVNLLLPNSDSEADIIRKEKQKDVPVIVIPNIVDVKKTDAIKREPWGKRSTILCVGHFCPRKNQLALIRALKGTDISIIFAGGFRPMHSYYYHRCRRNAKDQHTFLGTCSNEKVLELMGRAKVHIQTSFLETPGIANLEAGLMGCNVVLPPVDPVRDYFGNLGHIFASYDSGTIRKTILSAINTAPGHSIEDLIRRKYTMTQLKARLLVAYKPE